MRTKKDIELYNTINECESAITRIICASGFDDNEVEEVFLGLIQRLNNDLYNWKKEDRKEKENESK